MTTQNGWESKLRGQRKNSDACFEMRKLQLFSHNVDATYNIIFQK